MKPRGAVFQEHREKRGLSQEQVATLLCIEKKDVLAFELGLDMQGHREALGRLDLLMLEWAAEEKDK